VDADIRSFFDEISQEWLIKFLEQRIGDRRIIRLIQKWLKVGVLEEGGVSVSDRGTGQGSVISPLLANIYLHYCLDLWAVRRRDELTGDMIIVRYADDFIIGFQYESDARRFLDQMRKRLGEFGLSLHPEKTRLIEFGRDAAERRKLRGLGRPETFNFLGFTFICGKTRTGKFQIKRKTRADRMRAKLRKIKETLRRHMHLPIPALGKWLGRVVSGYFNYHAVPTNGRALHVFRHHVIDLWRRTLRRRSQKDRITWERMTKLADAWLPKPTILHPWPSVRFAVRHPRWEPYAGKSHVRFCAGACDETHVPTATSPAPLPHSAQQRSGVANRGAGAAGGAAACGLSVRGRAGNECSPAGHVPQRLDRDWLFPGTKCSDRVPLDPERFSSAAGACGRLGPPPGKGYRCPRQHGRRSRSKWSNNNNSDSFQRRHRCDPIGSRCQPQSSGRQCHRHQHDEPRAWRKAP
jgi:group II intron reverse transcriptase/maturase